MRSLFWKVFLTIWVASITEVVLASLMVNWDVRQRVSQFEVSERFTELAEFIITRYETGLDVITPEAASEEGEEGPAAELEPQSASVEDSELEPFLRSEDVPVQRILPGRQIMVIDDLLTGEKIFGNRFPDEQGQWVQWEMTTQYGGAYLVSVLNPTVNEFDLANIFTPFRITVAMIVTALFSWFLTSLLTGPLKGLRAHVEQLGSGQLDQRMEQSLIKRRDELGDLAKAINDMANRIQILLDSRQRLLYDVSHELRAPLARLQVASELARDKAEEAGVRQPVFDRLSNETDLLNRLISELLNLAKNETELCAQEKVRLDELIYRQVEDVRFSHPEREINSDLREGREYLSIRPLLLQRTIHNLLENAIKYSPEDKPVEVTIHKLPDQWQILVEDHGPGIPEEHLSSVFRPFNRLDADPDKGFGLGLSIAWRSITTLGGTIKLSNRSQGGLSVDIRLPR